MIEWTPPSEDVITIAKSLIEQYHPHLEHMRIGFVFRSEAPRQGGREIWGRAETVSDKWNSLLPEPMDFIIWLAQDVWDDLDYRQQQALIDHELMHCTINQTTFRPAIRPHDMEEFNAIIERHGLWRDTLRTTAAAFAQHPLPLEFQQHQKGDVISLKLPTGLEFPS